MADKKKKTEAPTKIVAKVIIIYSFMMKEGIKYV